jgi:hypothetical protein
MNFEPHYRGATQLKTQSLYFDKANNKNSVAITHNNISVLVAKNGKIS